MLSGRKVGLPPLFAAALRSLTEERGQAPPSLPRENQSAFPYLEETTSTNYSHTELIEEIGAAESCNQKKKVQPAYASCTL